MVSATGSLICIRMDPENYSDSKKISAKNSYGTFSTMKANVFGTVAFAAHASPINNFAMKRYVAASPLQTYMGA